MVQFQEISWLAFLILLFNERLRAGMSAVSFSNGRSATLAHASQALGAVLEASSRPDCSVFFLTQGASSTALLQPNLKLAHGTAAPWGVGVFEVAEDDLDGNATEKELLRVVGEARSLRMSSWCVNVVVPSDDPAFLASFAESSLRGRLLVWATRLLVVTRLPLQELRRLLASSWTFSMMNTLFMNLEDYFDGPRVKIYTHFPYGRDGSQVDEVASWTSGRGLSVRSGHQLFPEKFENFHGAKVGVTALPFRPYWIEEETKAPDGALQKTYSGSDGLLLTTIAGALNFSFAVLPVPGWGEVTSLVMERKSMMAAIYHILLPQRQERYDFTFTYEQIKTDFCMATPSLGSNWQSLYYPLSHGVWASVLAMLVVFSFVLYVVTNVFSRDDIQRLRSWGVTEVVLGSLLGQSIVQRTASSSGYRVLVATWLIFAFIVGTAYRGNLTAALTLPAYPPRPETIAQLVKAVESVTMPSYGTEFRNFFLQSESFEFKTLGAQMVIVPSALDGLRQALVKKQSHMDGRRYLDQMIAEHFTDARGEAQLYVGRQSVLPGLAGWPVPHDAPYKPQLDRLMMRIIEAGLYEKWSEDMLRQAREEGRQKEKERMEKQKLDGEQVEDEEADKSDKAKALNIVHMQGPLMLLLLGLLLGLLVFASELVVGGKTWP